MTIKYVNVQRAGRLGLFPDCDGQLGLIAGRHHGAARRRRSGGPTRDSTWRSDTPPGRRLPGQDPSPPLSPWGDASCRWRRNSSPRPTSGRHACPERTVGSGPPRWLPPPLSASGCGRPRYREERVVARPQRASGVTTRL